MLINPFLLQVLWTEIETIPNHVVRTLSDNALNTLLLQQVSNEIRLTGEERQQLFTYLGPKVSLIRDMADFRSLRNLSCAIS